MDSSSIGKLQFYVNPGFASYPVTGKNQVYNASFIGTVKVDWIGIGGSNCIAPLPTGIVAADENDVASSWPNPFKDETVLKFSSLQHQKLALKVMDMKGVSLIVKEGNTNENISIGKELPAGVYIVQTRYGNTFKTLRIVKMD
jgi:hypothetical protein